MIPKNLQANHRERIRASHRRSLDYGVERERVYPTKVLTGLDLETRIRENNWLLKVATPFVDLLNEFVSQSKFIVLFTDQKGCIIEMSGNAEMLSRTDSMGLSKGVYMDEESIGANAISIALYDDTPVQIAGDEHFIRLFHDWSCSAAPVHDEKGIQVGCINISGNLHNVYPHILGLVVASAKAIEYQLRSSFSEKRQKDAYHFVSQILNTLEFGVLATDINGKVRRANNLASRLLRAPLEKLEGHFLEDYISSWPGMLNQVKENNLVMDEEVNIKLFGVKETLSINVYPLTDSDGTISGTVVTLRDMKRVYRIVNKYTGMQARYNFDDIIGESDEMKRIIDYCRNIANSPSTVLIEGESGTGKEVLAQSIHNYSARKDGSFVALNCGAIPESLIESELFGYTEGAFTSAKKGGKPGKFELADGGTLFLDEIGEMPLDMQVKLLRALQERNITRVGGDKVIAVDVRIIAATNKNLLRQVQEGKFRQDLYYRLSVIPVYIPPLRNRREDIPMLINFFLNLKSVKLKKFVPDMDNRLFKKLVSYNWPGNVRELENFIEKYVNLNGNISWADQIMVQEMEIKTLDDPDVGIPNYFIKSGKNRLFSGNQILSLEELEIIAIENAIETLEGNMTHVASSLGISRNALYQKIKKYNISKKRD